MACELSMGSDVEGVDGDGLVVDFFFFLGAEDAVDEAAVVGVDDVGLDFFFFLLLEDGFFAASTAPPRESSPANAAFLAPPIPKVPPAGGREADTVVAAMQHAAAAEVTVIPFMAFVV